MKATPDNLAADERQKRLTKRQSAPVCRVSAAEEMDLSLLEESLAKTPWERMQANDDALRFGDSLREAMEERNAKP